MTGSRPSEDGAFRVTEKDMSQEIRFDIRTGTTGTAITRIWKAAVQEAMKHPDTRVLLHFEPGEHWIQPIGLAADVGPEGLDIIVSSDGSHTRAA
jgi:hypothetical protein